MNCQYQAWVHLRLLSDILIRSIILLYPPITNASLPQQDFRESMNGNSQEIYKNMKTVQLIIPEPNWLKRNAPLINYWTAVCCETTRVKSVHKLEPTVLKCFLRIPMMTWRSKEDSMSDEPANRNLLRMLEGRNSSPSPSLRTIWMKDRRIILMKTILEMKNLQPSPPTQNIRMKKNR